MVWLAIPVAFYLVVVALAYLFQDRLVFVGAGLGRGVALDAPAGVRVERLKRPDGSSFRIARCEPAGAPRAVLVFFDGNGADLRSGVLWARLWADLGVAAIVVEYPGYGDSEGTPGVASFREAAEAASEVAGASARSAGVPLVAGGISLGTFSAVHVTTRGSGSAGVGVARLLLLAPMTSVLDVATSHYPFLPVRWLLRHGFDSMGGAARVECPTLILHGDRDEIVPAAMGRKLAEVIGPRCEFVVVPNAGHNDLPITREPWVGRLRGFLGGR